MNPNPTDPGHDKQSDDGTNAPPRRAGLLQVAKTLFFGLFAVGMKGTWNKDGVQVTPGQIVAGAIAGGVLLILALVMIVRLVLMLATA